MVIDTECIGSAALSGAVAIPTATLVIAYDVAGTDLTAVVASVADADIGMPAASFAALLICRTAHVVCRSAAVAFDGDAHVAAFGGAGTTRSLVRSTTHGVGGGATHEDVGITWHDAVDRWHVAAIAIEAVEPITADTAVVRRSAGRSLTALAGWAFHLLFCARACDTCSRGAGIVGARATFVDGDLDAAEHGIAFAPVTAIGDIVGTGEYSAVRTDAIETDCVLHAGGNFAGCVVR